MHTFFDQNEFKADPIKKVFIYEDYFFKANFSQLKINKVKQSRVNLKDSWMDFTPGLEQTAYESK